MWDKIKKVIAKFYEWAWWGEDIGNEMLTYQFRRLAKARPVFFWGGVVTLALGSGGAFAFIMWFILHILGVA